MAFNMFAITPSEAQEARVESVTGHRTSLGTIRLCRYYTGGGAPFVGCLHQAEGHRQWNHGQGTSGHTWARYRTEARQLRRYLHGLEQRELVWHWQLVADCESGDDIYAVSSSGTYKGWLQFDQSSWSANGGSGSPYGQPRHVAAAVAENYRRRSGTSPWPVCGAHYR